MSSSCFGFAPEPSVLLPVFPPGSAPEPDSHPHAGSRRGSITVPLATPSASVGNSKCSLEIAFYSANNSTISFPSSEIKVFSPLSINTLEKHQNISCFLNCGDNQPEIDHK